MKLIPALSLAPLFLCLAHADTIRLKDGRELEGVVVSEQGDEYLVLVQVTATIRDQRRIPKKDVIEIVAEKKDEVAFEALKDLVPTPDRLDVADYDARIAKIENFVREFPNSRLVPKIEPILKTLEAERDVVADGGVKFEGKMLGADEREASAFTLDSQIVEAEFTQALEAGQRILALRAWDQLQKEFPTSRAYRNNLPKALGLMRSQLAAVTQQLETFDQRSQERLANLERVPEKDRARAREAIDDQAAAYLARIEKEKEAGIRWTSLDPFQKEPLSRAKSLLESEIRRLEGLDTSRIPDGDAAWTQAVAVLSAKPSTDEARAAIAKAREAQLPAKYIEMLEAMAPAK